MAAKRALVVDDSKSARVVLSRMLEKYGVEVDTAESAEQALEYLKANRPAVVFMDHMMPGMNGLEAVKLMKLDPGTAGIPVMMYTSQEGELYAGQAKAHGAVGVLPKSIKPIDVTKVLYQLDLLPDRRDGRPSALQPLDSPATGVSPEPAVAPQAPETEAVGPLEGLTEARVRGLVEALLKEQSIELRRFMVATLDSHAHRVASELRSREPEPELPPAPPPPPAAPVPWAWIGTAVAAIVALVVMGALYWQSLDTMREVDAARSRLEVESAALRATLAEVRTAAARRSEAPPPVAPAPFHEVPRPTVLRVPFGEPWLGGPRVDALRNTVGQLERSGFEGTVRVEAFAGQYCLTDDDDTAALATVTTPASKCGAMGNPLAEQGGDRAPLVFVNLAATVASRTHDKIQLTFARGGPGRDVVAYPGTQANAGQWNEAAEANNRVEITVVPK